MHPDVADVAGALTPVPGGVGPLTIAMLLKNTLRPRGKGSFGKMPEIALTTFSLVRPACHRAFVVSGAVRRAERR